MFSMLDSMDALEGASVLDLFAGSGALGIEALSRGAARVTFVDHDGAALAAIRENISVLGGAAGAVTVVRTDAREYARLASPVDLTFADPPYRFTAWPDLAAALVDRTTLLVAESGIEWDPGPEWETVKVRRYGGTVVTVAQAVARSRSQVRQEGET
jgi:16S rRNA (guanine(966)-N(2))-methyltransferase RsmD